MSYRRKNLAVVHNFTPEYYPDYKIPLANVKKVTEIFNTDAEKYGGSNKLNPEVTGFTISLAPLATMIFEVEFA